MSKHPSQIRQGDVFLLPVAQLPGHCTTIPPDKGNRFVLAYGEVTGHAHTVAASKAEVPVKDAELSNTARALGSLSVQMWLAPDGEWYLEVQQPSMLCHEEHNAIAIPPGIYHLPVQVEAGADDGIPWVVAD